MARLDWDAAGERFFESGIDRGVLYIGANPGVPWTGLISVSETPTGGDPRPYYQDGIKYANISSAEEFEASINAFSSPKEFAPCDGVFAVQNGLFATQQPRKSFGLSYRNQIGNDTGGQNYAYKIHLVYNALAGPSERNNETLGKNADPSSYTWQISTLPPIMNGMKPTAHFVIDSRYTAPLVLQAIEDILYGTDEAQARMPSVTELLTLFGTMYPSFKVVQLSPNVYQIYSVDPMDQRAIMSATAPAAPLPTEDPILWFDTSHGSYAIPKLVTGG